MEALFSGGKNSENILGNARGRTLVRSVLPHQGCTGATQGDPAKSCVPGPNPRFSISGRRAMLGHVWHREAPPWFQHSVKAWLKTVILNDWDHWATCRTPRSSCVQVLSNYKEEALFKQHIHQAEQSTDWKYHLLMRSLDHCRKTTHLLNMTREVYEILTMRQELCFFINIFNFNIQKRKG